VGSSESGNKCLLWLMSTYPHSAACGIFVGTGECQVVACRIHTGTWVWSNQCWLSTSTFCVVGAMVDSKRLLALVEGAISLIKSNLMPIGWYHCTEIWWGQ